MAVLILVAAVFFTLHAVHLAADFPNHSPWMDWAKYTDEGWYGDAAIRHYQRGHWYVHGDFNPAAALPVWPMLELVVFRLTGVSLTAARGLAVAIFGLILLSSYLLLCRWQQQGASLVAAAAVLLLAVSPFCFVFTRMAILEPLLILLMLGSLLAASAAPSAWERRGITRYLPTLALGFLLPLMVLTKTTAVFLFPSIFWLLWAASGYRLRIFLRHALGAASLGIALWTSYFLFFVRPHYLTDYRYLFSANAYTGITLATAGKVLLDTFHDGYWVGKLLYPAVLVSSGATLVLLRRRTSPLVVCLLLWVVGYAAFLAYHDNLQPRYYLVIAVPLTLLLPLVTGELVRLIDHVAPSLQSVTRLALVTLFAAILLPDASQTVSYVRKPEYTFVEAASRVRSIVQSNPSQSPLILSISGSNLSLMTGLPSICDDFGTMELAARVATYHPGWYLAWNQVDDDKMEALAPLYRLTRVAAIPAMDDPDRNLLILYRLDPNDAQTVRPRRKKAVVPRVLQTRLGQQPSTSQLEH